jgi:hypothetical protein
MPRACRTTKRRELRTMIEKELALLAALFGEQTFDFK